MRWKRPIRASMTTAAARAPIAAARPQDALGSLIAIPDRQVFADGVCALAITITSCVVLVEAIGRHPLADLTMFYMRGLHIRRDEGRNRRRHRERGPGSRHSDRPRCVLRA